MTMIMINFTGLERVYWWPKIEWQGGSDGIWYVSIRWLGIEYIVYSLSMGCEVVRRINQGGQ